MHLPVAHSVSTFAAGRIHHDFAGELTQRGIKKQRTSLQMKSSSNRVKYVSEREVDGRALRIKLNGQALRGGRNADAYKKEKYYRRRERRPQASNSPRVSVDRATQSVAPIPG